MSGSELRHTLAIVVALVTCGLVAQPALADSMYSPTKTIKVDAKGNPTVKWQYFTAVWIATNTGDPIDSQYKPNGKPPQFKEFDPFGTFFVKDGTNDLRNHSKSGDIPVVRGNKNVPAAGLKDNEPVSVEKNKNLSAEANASVDIKAIAAGQPVEGTIDLKGMTKNEDDKHAVVGKAYSFSDGLVTVSGTDKDGKVTVAPSNELSAKSNTDKVFRDDPILFHVSDYLTGETLLEGSLLDTLEELSGAGSLTWRNDMFSVDAIDVAFHVDANSPYIPNSQRGTLDLIIANGLITQSDGTGIFANIFPGVGQSGTFSVPLSNTLFFDYDFGDFGDRLVTTTLEFDDAAGALSDATVPEPGAMMLLGTGFVLLASRLRRTRRDPPSSLCIPSCAKTPQKSDHAIIP
jgi:PEP-CTERM motif